MRKVSFVVYALDEKYQFLDLIVHDASLEKLKEKLLKVQWETIKEDIHKKLLEPRKIS